MKKKYELIKYAYDNYAKSVKFKSAMFPDGNTNDVYLSSGSFIFDEKNSVFDSGETGACVYNDFTNKWAEIIPESILSGKVAIRVDNEREFKLLMEHYESKGWKWDSGHNPLEEGCYLAVVRHGFPTQVHYRDSFLFNLNDKTPEIPFADFAAEVGIKVPVKIMVSEDGKDLYEGDDYHEASLQSTNEIVWEHIHSFNHKINERHRVVKTPHKSKAFSTKEAAKKWIAEVNKPSRIEITHTDFEYSSITKDDVTINYSSGTEGFSINLTGKSIESIYKAYQSLQEATCKD